MLAGLPVRLEYACGHHALVSLDAVKHEGPRQRRERIEHEKAAARLRRCDFCGPTMQAEAPLEHATPVATVVEAVEPAEPAPVPVPVIAVAPEVDGARRRARSTTRIPKTRYHVSFVHERVIEAATILDAIAQAEARGLGDIIAVTRIPMP